MINWFAVHATSMNNINTLVSGDNKGYASYALREMNERFTAPGQGPFVGALLPATLEMSRPTRQAPNVLIQRAL